jgi:hypothetical protein
MVATFLKSKGATDLKIQHLLEDRKDAPLSLHAFVKESCTPVSWWGPYATSSYFRIQNSHSKFIQHQIF